MFWGYNCRAMDIFFQDPSEIPLPPAEVRIQELRAEPWPDGKRVRVYVEVAPFQKRPSIDLSISNEKKEVVAAASIIETMVRKLEMTLHIRSSTSGGTFALAATLYYSKPPEASKSESHEAEEGPQSISYQVVDQSVVTFQIAG